MAVPRARTGERFAFRMRFPARTEFSEEVADEKGRITKVPTFVAEPGEEWVVKVLSPTEPRAS